VREVAERIVDALPDARGQVLVRDRCGRAELVDAVVAVCRSRGLDPLVEHVPNGELRRVIGSASPAELSRWDVDRADVTASVSALVVLGGWPADLEGLPADSVDAWAAAVGRSERVLEERRVPTVVVAVPSDDVAGALGRSLADLDDAVLPAVLVPAQVLRAHADRLLHVLAASQELELVTGAHCLRLQRGTRPLMVDDGVVDRADREVGAVVSNLPAGSVYWTVVEPHTRGAVGLVDGTVLDFDDDGCVVAGPHRGERVSHLGLGLNPAVGAPVGWTIVDEHRPGALFLALGENRYMGGENASAVNVDLLPDRPTLRAGATPVVVDGRLVSR
jgi:leucyl aminopeptidase (aminopeptidase T)